MSDRGPFAAWLTDALYATAPGVRVVLTSRCGEPAAAVVRATGAARTLGPGARVDDVLAAVLAAASGAPAPLPVAPQTALTARERDVLALLTTGATNAEIGHELHLSAEGVKKHARSIYRKLGVRNRTEAARRAPEVL